MLDFKTFLNRPVAKLSGGQRRRIDIARALLHKPEILILDEPASGLDPWGRREIFNIIKKMNREMGICILLVSHSMDDVAKYADKVMVFSKGELVRYDVPGKVFADSDYLESISLKVPQSKRVLEMLKKRGVEIDTSPYTTESAAQEILRRFKK